ncbi:hypothetical protein KPL44_22350 [Clostridium sp. DSM 17811]|uniref:hypothetical protein n=1 Tax=Clostridium sp. DSM 17811 TaxID=2843317 RepID=UPI001C0DE0A5|nr:hypothetical protein [Clostridium sp. DSM 17811]MBU3101986.1 hypothetical protein [Clostridium sp. DSM 17811]
MNGEIDSEKVRGELTLFLGGIISGGLTYASMKPMGRRLKDTLAESINYTEEEFDKDADNI